MFKSNSKGHTYQTSTELGSGQEPPNAQTGLYRNGTVQQKDQFQLYVRALELQMNSFVPTARDFYCIATHYPRKTILLPFFLFCGKFQIFFTRTGKFFFFCLPTNRSDSSTCTHCSNPVSLYFALEKSFCTRDERVNFLRHNNYHQVTFLRW